MKTKTDKAFGVVPVYEKAEGIEVLLVKQVSYRKDSFWILPKGHAEGDENPIEAALRELKEETGLTEVTLDGGQSFEIAYSFNDNDVRIDKTVTYFLGRVTDPTTEITQPHEILELRWCTPAAALELLTHENSKRVLREALGHCVQVQE